MDYRDTFDNVKRGAYPNPFAAIDASAIGGSPLAAQIKAVVQHSAQDALLAANARLIEQLDFERLENRKLRSNNQSEKH